MPRERFSDEYLARFKVQHGEAKREPRHRSSNQVWSLATSHFYPRREIRVTLDHWSDIVRVTERNGYRFAHETAGLGGEHVTLFAKALRQALTQEKVALSDSALQAAAQVLSFVEGAAKRGFQMMRQWA